MWQKLFLFPQMLYLTITGFSQNLKNDERGLSGVVVSVLLILISVLAIAFLWGGLGTYLKQVWGQITGVGFAGL